MIRTRLRNFRYNQLTGRHSAFVLLEVIVSIVIIGVSVATIMRSFTISMSAIRKNDVQTQAFVLAESLLQALEADPPTKGKRSGNFEDDGFPAYSWELEVDVEEIKYKNLKTASKIEDLKPLTHVNLKIIYDDSRNRKMVPVQVDLLLPPVERFLYQSKFLNELFLEDERR